MSPYSLQPHIRLHELRRDAKGLLECALDGDVPCLERFYEIGREPSLTAAQLLVARDHGFSSWAKLKQQVERNTADPRTEAVRQMVLRRDREPDDELGVVVPYEQIVASAPGTILAISSVRVYSDRCLIDLEGRTSSYVGFDMPEITGVWFADGRTSNPESDWSAMAMADPGVDLPILGEQSATGGCHGGSRTSLWPLPPPGDVRLTISWRRAGIADGTPAVFDATPIQAAVTRNRSFTVGPVEADVAPDGLSEPKGPPDDAVARRRRSHAANLPEDQLYAVVPVDAVVARSSRLAVAFHAIRVHRTGCLIDVEWKLPKAACRSPQMSAVPRPFWPGTPTVDGRLPNARYGIEFSDGRAVEYAGGWRYSGEDAPVLLSSGGSFGSASGRYLRGETDLVLAPLPPPGEVRFWFAWPELGVPETTTILDGTAIRRAALRVQ